GRTSESSSRAFASVASTGEAKDGFSAEYAEYAEYAEEIVNGYWAAPAPFQILLRGLRPRRKVLIS
ncbi:MAG: hypothetical protein PVI22_14365, partial [Lysobacterales bacterium]